MEKHSPHSKPWYAPLVHFTAHTFVGSAIFLIILCPAVFLGWLVHKLEQFHVSEFTVTVLLFLEHSILVVDALLFLAYLVVTSISAIKEMR
jgi:hypothetical protein